MLYIASANDASRAGLRQPEPNPIKILSANSFAHGKYAPYELARMAAAWIDGRVLLTPSTEIASRIFHNVSRRLIREERRKLPRASLPLGCLTWGWLKASEAERAAFIDEYSGDVWATFDRITDPIPAIPAPPAKSDDDADYAQWLADQEAHWLDGREG